MSLYDEIAADPDAVGPYAVLGDQLQAAGDPRGELIAAQLGRETAAPIEAAELCRRAAALIDANPAWLGELAAHHRMLVLRWRRGFIHAARLHFREDDPEHRAAVAAALDALLAIPHAADTLAELHLGGEDDEQLSPAAALAQLVERWPRALRRLHVGYGDLRVLAKAEPLALPELPPLDELHVWAKTIEFAARPQVKRLHLVGRPGRSFAQPWPELEELVLVAPTKATLKLLDARRFPKLARLGLWCTDDTDELIAALPIAHQLAHLDLRGGTATAKGARAIMKIVPSVELRGNYVGGKKLAVGYQRKVAKDDAPAPIWGTYLKHAYMHERESAALLDPRMLPEGEARIAELRAQVMRVPTRTATQVALALDGKGEMPQAECLLWDAAIDARFRDDKSDEVRCLGHLATLQMRCGSPSSARPLLARIAAYYAKEEPYALPWAKRQQGNAELLSSNYPAAEKFYTEALELYTAKNDKPNIAIVMSELAGVHWSRQDYATAEQLLRDSLAMREDEQSTGSVYYNLGALLNGMHRLADAREAATKSLEAFTKLQHRHGQGIARSLLGELAQRQNQHAEAQRLLEEALADHRASGGKREEGVTLGNLARVALDLGDYARAKQCCEDAVELHREVGNKFNEGMQLMDLARAYLGEGELAAASARLEESLIPFRAIANHPGLAAVEYYRGIAHHLAGNIDVALEDYRASARSAELAKSEDQVASAELAQAIAAWQSGDRARAEALYAAADARSSHDVHDVEVLGTVRALLDDKPFPATHGYGARLLQRFRR